jgi:hypothetical protein
MTADYKGEFMLDAIIDQRARVDYLGDAYDRDPTVGRLFELVGASQMTFMLIGRLQEYAAASGSQYYMGQAEREREAAERQSAARMGYDGRITSNPGHSARRLR